MKKFLAGLALLALLAPMVFADEEPGITFSFWGRAAFSPLTAVSDPKTNGEVRDRDKDSGGLFVGTGSVDGENNPVLEFSIQGGNDFAGFGLGIGYNEESNAGASGIGAIDLGAHVWIKPLSNDYLKLTVGKFTDDTLRGKIGLLNDGFERFVLYFPNYEEDAIFSQFDTGLGFMLSSVPLENLWVGVMIGGGANLWNIQEGQIRPNFWDTDNAVKATEAYQFVQAGVGYELPCLGHARLQFVGGFIGTDPVNPGDKHYVPYDVNRPARLEAAFAFTAIDKLLVDFGVRPWLPVKLENSAGRQTDHVWNGVGLSLGAMYDFSDILIDGLEAAIRADANLGAFRRKGEGDKQSAGQNVAVRFVPSFDLGFAKVGVDFGFYAQSAGRDTDGYLLDENSRALMQFGVGAFLLKEVGGAALRVGVANSFAPLYGKDRKANGSNVFSIPVILSYSL